MISLVNGDAVWISRLYVLEMSGWTHGSFRRVKHLILDHTLLPQFLRWSFLYV